MIDKTTEDVTMLPDGIIFPKTPEEMKKEIEKNRQPDAPSGSTILYRRIQMNLYLLQLLGMNLMSGIAFGSLTVIFLKFSAAVVAVFTVFLVLSLVVGYLIVIWNLHTPVNPLAQSRIAAGNKDLNKLGKDGRTVPGR